MLNTYDFSALAGYTTFSQTLPSSLGFGPETNVHPAIVVNHSCDTRIADRGRATTNLFVPSKSYTCIMGPVTVALGT